MASLILMGAPPSQLRLMRPLTCRTRLKRLATRQIVAGSLSLAVAFTLGTNLVISSLFGNPAGMLASATMALLVLCLWY